MRGRAAFPHSYAYEKAAAVAKANGKDISALLAAGTHSAALFHTAVSPNIAVARTVRPAVAHWGDAWPTPCNKPRWSVARCEA